MMRLVFLGPPGVGKGTQAEFVAKELKIPHYSTGDIFRKILKDSSSLSKELAKFVNTGELVPDDIVFETLKETLFTSKANNNGWVLDGYPRNKAQAEMLDNLLANNNEKIDYAIYLSADREILAQRLSSRRVCSECGTIYNLAMNPPKREGICDKCRGKLIQRKDDKIETVLKRIFIFEKEFSPLKEYYESRGILLVINGEGTTKEVFNQIKKGLNLG